MAVLPANRSNSISGSRRTSRRWKAYHTRCDGRNHFLNATFASIPGCDIPNGEAVIDVKDIKQNIKELQSDVSKFFSKYGIVCELPMLVGNFKKDTLALYNLLKANLPNEDWKVEVIQQHGKNGPVKFLVYTYVKFPEYTVWTVPVKKMEKVDDKTRKLLALTFAVMNRSDMYEFPEGSYDFQYCLAQCDNNFHRDENGKQVYDEYQTECWDDDYRKMAIRYVEGDISELFNEIKEMAGLEDKLGKPLCDILEDMISQYRSENYHNPHLLNLIEQELEICREDWLSNYHIGILKKEYGEDFTEDIQEEEFMDFARLFFFCYDDNDCITQSVIECLNSDAYNLVLGCLCRCSFIDNDDIKERMESSYPERWAEVNNKLIAELRK